MGQVGWVQVMVRTEHAIMTQCPVIALGPSLLALLEGVSPTCVAKALFVNDRASGRYIGVPIFTLNRSRRVFWES